MTLPMIAGSGAMALMFSFQKPGPLGYLTGGMFGVSMLGMLFAQVAGQSGQPSKAEMVAARREYMRHLAQHRKDVRKTIAQQRKGMLYRHPNPETLWSTAASHRLWERRPVDGDFGVIRIGLGPLEIATQLVPPQTRPAEDLEPMCAAALRRFVKTYAIVPDLPVALALNGFSRIHMQGTAEAKRAMVRALLAQVTTFHAPDDVLIAICCDRNDAAEWDWAKWLPHTAHPEKTDALGPVRLVAHSLMTLEAMLDNVLGARPRFNPEAAALDSTHVVVVYDGGDMAGSDHLMTEGGIEGVTFIDLTSRPPRVPDRTALVLEIDAENQLHSTSVDGREKIGRADAMSVPDAESLSRQLSPLRLSVASRGEQALTLEMGLVELLKLGDPRAFEPIRAWTPRPNRDKLRVPIGIGPDGSPIDLDIKESAQDGMGPHGLLVGATGSGKSELLRTLVLALAVTHSPEVLNFVLVDFKGGATFTSLDQLPHTSATITNLADEISLVDRMHDAISGELLRRQEVLRKAGNYASQRDYERARAAGAPLAPLPSLLIICDEFSELLTAKPDFIDMFVQIGRVGRSLGVHLLLASQRLEEGRLRGLDTHLSYRVGLRTFSSTESRAAIGVPDAYELPRAPGHGYLKFGTEPLVRFRAAYVSGVYKDTSGADNAPGDPTASRVLAFGTGYVAPPLEDEPEETKEAEEEYSDADTVLHILVARMEGKGMPAHQVWLPPLAEPSTLDQLFGPLGTDPNRGLTVKNPELHGSLRVVTGIVDRPIDQRRDPMWLDLSGGAGHVIIVGGPQSGKSTILRALVGSLALTHTPREAQFYCLDFGGGSLASLRGLPHVGGVAGRLDVNQVRRTVAEVKSLLDARETMFAANGVESMQAYRQARRAGRFGDDPFGDVFLVVDGWLTLRNEYEDLELAVMEIANRGLSYGVHVVATASRWNDIRPALRDIFGSRLELRLGDPTDSVIDRKGAMNVPVGAPGRGITPEGLHFLGALPRIDGVGDPDSLSTGSAAFVSAVAGAWQYPPAPKVRLLPDRIDWSVLPTPAQDETRAIPIGINETDLQPVYLDFDAEPHFLLFGDIEAGKSSFLRSVARGIQTRYDRSQARILLLDYRRSLLGSVGQDHLLAYGTSAQVAADMVRDVATVMKGRLPGPDVTAEQLRSRSWWKGPEVFVLVDDYDLVASGQLNPLAPLLDYLAQARDIGLHFVVTRRVGGASRALYDPIISRLRELASPGMIMSGPKDEGVLLGNVRPEPLPPGRGRLVSRRDGVQLVQLAWTPPDGLSAPI